MIQKVRPAELLAGEIEIPGDKSISHRAVILNSVAKGTAKISNFLRSADTLATVNCLLSIGADIHLDLREAEETEAIQVGITGKGLSSLSEANHVLDARNSGTTIRLLTGLLSSTDFFSVISGDSSLNRRPMGRLIEPLRMMGACIWGREKDSKAPLAIQGQRLKGIEYTLPVASAQLKSALILAGLFADGETIIHEPGTSRDHTERLVKAMGASIEIEDETILVKPGTLSALDITVPGDISSAAYWLVAGAVHPNAKVRILNAGVNPTRLGIIEVLRAMGAQVLVGEPDVSGGEPVSILEVESGNLSGVEIDGSIIPRLIDEIPLVALTATQAEGKTVIRDAAELRVKESDRIQTTAQELTLLGADIEELSDGMVINGPTVLRGTRCHSHGDHRLAMTLGVAGLIADGETTIEEAQAVEVSYPKFWGDLERLTRS